MRYAERISMRAFPPLVPAEAGTQLVGLCPGPAVENLATPSLQVLIFVASMLVSMALHDLWQRTVTADAPRAAPVDADG
jgi:hypothetical protein